MFTVQAVPERDPEHPGKPVSQGGAAGRGQKNRPLRAFTGRVQKNRTLRACADRDQKNRAFRACGEGEAGERKGGGEEKREG